jgi:hypothetical protein
MVGWSAAAVGVPGATRIPVMTSRVAAKMAGRRHRMRDIVVVSLLGQGGQQWSSRVHDRTFTRKDEYLV